MYGMNKDEVFLPAYANVQAKENGYENGQGEQEAR
jgi:hypothetical protein